MKTEPVNILLVDDDDVAIMSMKRAMKKLKIANPYFVANNGLEALDLLRGSNVPNSVPTPYLVLLDLNMPRMNGFEFLDEVRKDDNLRHAIIFVLTTSNADRDKVEAYNKNVAGYIVKSDVSATFMDALKMLDHYWRVIEFPC